MRNGKRHYRTQPLHLHDGGFCVGHLGLVSEGRDPVSTNDPFNFFMNLVYAKKAKSKPGDKLEGGETAPLRPLSITRNPQQVTWQYRPESS